MNEVLPSVHEACTSQCSAKCPLAAGDDHIGGGMNVADLVEVMELGETIEVVEIVEVGQQTRF